MAYKRLEDEAERIPRGRTRHGGTFALARNDDEEDQDDNYHPKPENDESDEIEDEEAVQNLIQEDQDETGESGGVDDQTIVHDGFVRDEASRLDSNDGMTGTLGPSDEWQGGSRPGSGSNTPAKKGPWRRKRRSYDEERAPRAGSEQGSDNRGRSPSNRDRASQGSRPPSEVVVPNPEHADEDEEVHEPEQEVDDVEDQEVELLDIAEVMRIKWSQFDHMQKIEFEGDEFFTDEQCEKTWAMAYGIARNACKRFIEAEFEKPPRVMIDMTAQTFRQMAWEEYERDIDYRKTIALEVRKERERVEQEQRAAFESQISENDRIASEKLKQARRKYRNMSSNASSSIASSTSYGSRPTDSNTLKRSLFGRHKEYTPRQRSTYDGPRLGLSPESTHSRRTIVVPIAELMGRNLVFDPTIIVEIRPGVRMPWGDIDDLIVDPNIRHAAGFNGIPTSWISNSKAKSTFRSSGRNSDDSSGHMNYSREITRRGTEGPESPKEYRNGRVLDDAGNRAYRNRLAADPEFAARISAQRMHNSSKFRGFVPGIPDQGVMFDEHGNPVERPTIPRDEPFVKARDEQYLDNDPMSVPFVGTSWWTGTARVMPTMTATQTVMPGQEQTDLLGSVSTAM